MGEETTTAVAKPQLVAGAPAMAIVPRNMDELGRLAVMLQKSRLAPKGMESPEAIAAAVMMGLEVGLTPMQAVQNIAVINGRPSIWGDAALALVRSSGLLAEFREEPIVDEAKEVVGYRCTARRAGANSEITHSFTLKDARRAGLVNKDTWKGYPQRMCQMRARSWVLRDGFADVLKGLSVREEAADIDVTIPAQQRTIEDGSFVQQRTALPEPDPLLERLQPAQAAQPEAVLARSYDAQPLRLAHPQPTGAEDSDLNPGILGGDAPAPSETPTSGADGDDDVLDGFERAPWTREQQIKIVELRKAKGLHAGDAWRAWIEEQGMEWPADVDARTAVQATHIITRLANWTRPEHVDKATGEVKGAAVAFDRKAVIAALGDCQDAWVDRDGTQLAAWEMALKARGLTCMNWMKKASDETLAALVEVAHEIEGK